MRRMKLIDISKWDGQPADALKVAEQEYEGVLIRSSYGLTVDPLFRYYWNTFRGRLKRFAYHYFMPAYDWKQQALVMYNQLAPELGEGNNFLDIESTGGILPVSRIFEMAHSFLKYMDQLIVGKVPAGIYTARWFWDANGGATQTWVLDERRHLWAASYPYDKVLDFKLKQRNLEELIVTNDMLMPITPKPWTRAKLWQWSAKGTVPGIVALDVDLDVSVDDRAVYMQEMGWVDVPPPSSLDQLYDRFAALERWAESMGYKLGG